MYTGIPITGLNPISLDIVKLEGLLLLGPKCRCKATKTDKCPKKSKKNKQASFFLFPVAPPLYTHTGMVHLCVGYCWEAYSVPTLTHTVTHTHTQAKLAKNKNRTGGHLMIMGVIYKKFGSCALASRIFQASGYHFLRFRPASNTKMRDHLRIGAQWARREMWLGSADSLRVTAIKRHSSIRSTSRYEA